MELDRAHVRWRKIRIPLFAGMGLILLLAAGVGVFFWLRDVSIRSDIEKARKAAAADTVEGMDEASKALARMAGKHPGRSDVQAAHAYVLALGALRNGPLEMGLEKASAALARSDAKQGGELFHAASALILLAHDQPEKAAAALTGLPGDAGKAPEVKLVRLMSQIEAGQSLEARVELELMAVREEPFLPAVTLLGRLRHRLGDLDGARALLTRSLELHPGRLEASLELALVLMDMGTDESLDEADELLDSLAPSLVDAPPILATEGLYARGMLLMRREKYADAAGPLCEAAARMQKDTMCTARCARARRLSGDIPGALEALSSLAMDDSTPTTALAESVEANLALWRPVSAGKALALISIRPDVDARTLQVMKARSTEQRGDFVAAAKAWQQAGNVHDYPVRAGLAMLEAGLARDAKGYLKDLTSGQSAGCAQALRDWSRGYFDGAFKELVSTESCEPALRGRFLLLDGRWAQAAEVLAMVGDADPRVEVLLARATFRTSGAQAARSILDALLMGKPESVTLLRDIAMAFIEMELSDDARGAAADAVARNPGDPDALALQIKVLRLTSDPASAWELLEPAIVEYPDHPGLLVEQAHSFIVDRNYEAAVISGQKAMVNGIHLADAAIVTANAYMGLKNDVEADSVLRQAAGTLFAHHEPTLCAGVYAELVKIRRQPPDKVGLAKSKGVFSMALKKDVRSALLYFQGALTFLADGRKDDALLWLHEAAASDPAFKPAFQKLDQLEDLTDEERTAYQTTNGASI